MMNAKKALAMIFVFSFLALYITAPARAETQNIDIALQPPDELIGSANSVLNSANGSASFEDFMRSTLNLNNEGIYYGPGFFPSTVQYKTDTIYQHSYDATITSEADQIVDNGTTYLHHAYVDLIPQDTITTLTFYEHFNIPQNILVSGASQFWFALPVPASEIPEINNINTIYATTISLFHTSQNPSINKGKYITPYMSTIDDWGNSFHGISKLYTDAPTQFDIVPKAMEFADNYTTHALIFTYDKAPEWQFSLISTQYIVKNGFVFVNLPACILPNTDYTMTITVPITKTPSMYINTNHPDASQFTFSIDKVNFDSTYKINEHTVYVHNKTTDASYLNITLSGGDFGPNRDYTKSYDYFTKTHVITDTLNFAPHYAFLFYKAVSQSGLYGRTYNLKQGSILAIHIGDLTIPAGAISYSNFYIPYISNIPVPFDFAFTPTVKTSEISTPSYYIDNLHTIVNLKLDGTSETSDVTFDAWLFLIAKGDMKITFPHIHTDQTYTTMFYNAVETFGNPFTPGKFNTASTSYGTVPDTLYTGKLMTIPDDIYISHGNKYLAVVDTNMLNALNTLPETIDKRTFWGEIAIMITPYGIPAAVAFKFTVDTFTDGIDDYTDKVISNLEGYLQGSSSLTGSFFLGASSILNNIESMISNAISVISSFFMTIYNFLKSIYNAVIDALTIAGHLLLAGFYGFLLPMIFLATGSKLITVLYQKEQNRRLRIE